MTEAKRNGQTERITLTRFATEAIEVLTVLAAELEVKANEVEDEDLKNFLEKAAAVAKQLKEMAKKAVESTSSYRGTYYRNAYRGNSYRGGNVWRRRRTWR